MIFFRKHTFPVFSKNSQSFATFSKSHTLEFFRKHLQYVFAKTYQPFEIMPKDNIFRNPTFLNVFENVSMDLFSINYLSKSHPDIFSKTFTICVLRKYYSSTGFRNHAMDHFSWTCFLCVVCNYIVLMYYSVIFVTSKYMYDVIMDYIWCIMICCMTFVRMWQYKCFTFI